MRETGEVKAGRGLTTFARRLSAEWGRLGLPTAEARAVLAVSGGADSTALLLAFDELARRGLLGVEFKVAHLDHGLRGEAGAADALWVEGLARGLGRECETGRASVGGRDNLEQAARRERYEFLARVAREWRARVVLTAHTLDDQAETFLLALLRGSGADGLGAMRPVRALDAAGPEVLLARPLLSWARRAETEGYCRARGVGWREDAMNDDERYARVRVRRRLLPLLETFNPRAAEALARTASLLREDSAALDAEAAQLLEAARDEGARPRPRLKAAGAANGGARGRANGDSADGRAGDNGTDGRAAGEACGEAGGVSPLRVEVLAQAPAAVRRRALRLWLSAARGDLRRLELVHIEAVERLLAGVRGGRVAELPGGCSVVRRRRWLFFRENAGRGGKSVEVGGGAT